MDTLMVTGESAPNFELADLHGTLHSLESIRGWIVVLVFWSPECDWCERIDRELVAYLQLWKERVKVWWIASNANEPREAIENAAAERNIPLVLLDPDQTVADLLAAQTTPHLFVIDSAGKLMYQGAWDDITFRQRTATQKYVVRVVDALIEGRVPEVSQTQPYGCMLLRSGENAD